MLSRTADHVYWMGRFAERAENLTLQLEVQYRLSLLPHAVHGTDPGWAATLESLGQAESYAETCGEIEPHRVVDFLAFDRNNPSSVVSCLRLARENAHAVRGAITSEIWESINATWLEARTLTPSRFSTRNLSEFIEWVKYRSHVARGVVLGSMPRDEAYHFNQLGTFLERADGVARLLRVRLQRGTEPVDAPSATDYYPWSVLLRALSAFELYRRASRDRVTPLRVIEFMVFRDDVPRSLHRSLKQVYDNLGDIANSRSAATERRAGALHARLRFGSVETAAAAGLDPFLDEFINALAELSDFIAQDFLGHLSP